MPLGFDADHTEGRCHLAGQAVFWDTFGVSRTLGAISHGHGKRSKS